MLPPLGAALSASIDYQTTSRQPVPIPLAAAAGHTRTLPVPVNLLSGGRVDLLSLSGQMHLAQGLSAFAEAVGSYLKISRREGESLVDYAHRLADAFKSLSTAQRAALEQSIAQLMRGITLRMLTEILDNPLGPDAARLNAYMESMPVQDRDPAARAVVSSYRQNAAAESWAASGGQPRPTAGNPAVSAPAVQINGGRQHPPGHGPASTAQVARAGSAIEPGQRPSSSGSEIGADPADNPVPSRERIPDGPRTTTPLSGVLGAASRSAQATPEPLAGGGASYRGEPLSLSLSRTSADAPVAREATGRGEGTDRSSRTMGQRGSLVIYDAPALARIAQRPPEGLKDISAQQVLYSADRLAMASELPGTPGTVLASSLRSTSAAPLLPAQDEPLGDIAAPAEIGSPPNPHQSGILSNFLSRDLTEIPLSAQAPIGDSGSKATGTGALIEQALFLPMAAMAAREGIMQPLIAYPPVPVPPEEEERDVERLSPVDEDGEGQSSEQRAGNGEQDDTPEDDDADSPPLKALADGDATDHAQDLYWRMADLS